MSAEVPLDQRYAGRTSTQRLYDRITITAASRFNASRRLSLHSQFSLWTITLFSLGLVFVSVMQAVGLPLSFTDKVVNVGQVFLSITILVFSSMLSMSNYGTRAERFHMCGLELSELSLKLEATDSESAEEDLTAYSREYNDILKRYENHHNIDYIFMRLQKRHRYSNPWWYVLQAHGRYWFQFVPYVALLGLLFAWIAALVWKNAIAA